MFGEMIGTISDFMYSYLLIIMLLAVGLYFTIRTRGVQLRLLAESIRVVGEKSSSRESVSAFQALMVSTASRVGTGNIVGVANAIAVGGYGAVFWMWIIALLGGASAFIESTLAQIYKVRDKNGGSYGGPSYYIQAALKSRWLGVVFAAALIATYAGGFNMLASFNLIDSMSGYSFYGDPQTSLVPLVGGGLLAVLVAVCVLGGGRRIVRITGLLVPFMGVTYILMALVVMALNFQMLPQVFGRIIAGAFDFRAIFGGFAGSALMEGIKRGLYSNEAGVGSAPNAAAAADVSHPVKQGLVQMLSVFIDTLLVCTATAMMCLCTGIVPSEQLKGAAFVQQSLSTTFGSVGPYFLTLALLLFAFTTLLGNLFYCEGCLRYITRERIGKRGLTVFRLAAAALVFAGAQMEFDLVWDVADVLMGVMALINLPVIVLLGRTALSALKDYTMGVGFIVMALSYAVMAMAPSIAVFYVGCLIFGLGMSVVMPGVFLNVGNSVGPAAVGMALSIATCVQNFGQFCSPYLFNPIAQAVSGESGLANVASFYVAAGIGALLGVIMLIRAAASGKKA